MKRRFASRLWLTAFALSLALFQPALPTTSAAEGDVGYRNQHFTGIGTEVTGAKPQSKLWWADGMWWGIMWDETQNGNFIYRLELATQTWSNTGTRVDGRATTRSDALWDGTKLYVGSQLFSTLGAAGQNARLYRFSYDPGADRYSLDAGFPVNINAAKSESLVIDKDSTGRLWATWVQDARVYVNSSTTSDAVWGTPFVLPVAGAANLTTDDISSVVAFEGNRIGVMWSNQNDSALYFAEHVDGAPPDAWEASRTAIQGPNNADDHINLKSIHAGAGGQVYAAVKTSQTAGAAPLIMLLVRDPATGNWASHVFGQVRDHHTRPIVMLDDVNRTIYMFATSNETGGTIYMKSTSMDAISFEAGLGTPFIRDAASPDMNDATSTKQSVNPTSGLVVLASDDTTDHYWHNYLPLGDPQPEPLAADFNAEPRTGTAPLAVTFSDLSTGSPTSWLWDFGDGETSTDQHPSHTYTAAGTYTVSLTATNADDTDTKVEADHVTVAAPPSAPPVADFEASPLSGTAPLQVAFTDLSTGSPTSWLWDFGDGSTSDEQGPTHTYTTAGTYTISLTATNGGGTDTKTEADYVTVAPPAPSADFAGSPLTGNAPLPVTFTDLSTGSPTSWSWDFGDGTSSTSQSPTHTYATAGRYTVSLTATNAGGNTTRTRTDYVVVGTRVVATASADAYVRSQQATTNFGTKADLRVRVHAKDAYRSYLSFSVSGISGPVTGARLRLWVNSGGTDGGSVLRVTSPWSEQTITWRNAPPPSGTSLGQAGAVTAGGWVEIALSPAAFSSGNGTYSFALVSSDGSSPQVQYASRETATRPQLLIDVGPP
ncbi:MAG: PKD domain-containing protein [Candidatus Limnocylindria bacterium]